MIKRNSAKTTQTRARQQRNEPKRWRTYSLMIVCGLLMVSGFFFAGRQHFSSMDYGMKNSRLRKQIDDLEAEKRRLLLAREISLSPAEIKRAAKKVGFSDSAEAQPEVVQEVATSIKEKAVPTTAAAPIKPMVVKTASVSSVPAPIAAVYAKNEKPVKTAKRLMATE